MTNPFSGRALAVHGTALDIVPVTPDDTLDLENVGTALYVETGGQVHLLTAAGSERTVNVADMSILPVGVARVFATGTTASGIHSFSVVK